MQKILTPPQRHRFLFLPKLDLNNICSFYAVSACVSFNYEITSPKKNRSLPPNTVPFRTFHWNLSWHQGISIKIVLQHSTNFLNSSLICKGRFDWDIIWLSKLETRICSLSFQNVSLKKLLHKQRKQSINCGFQSNGLPPSQRIWTPL